MDQGPKTTSGSGTPVDLRTWAAYVLGCQPRIIHIRQEELATRLSQEDWPGSDEAHQRLSDAMGQMDDAIGLLAGKHLLSPKNVHDIHIELRYYFQSCLALRDGAFAGELVYPDGYVLEAEWWRLDEVSRSLTIADADEDLEKWKTLGQSLGAYLVDYSPLEYGLDSKRSELVVIAEKVGELIETPAGSKVADLAVEMFSRFEPDRSISEFSGFADRFGKELDKSAGIEVNDLPSEECPEFTPEVL